MAERSSEGIDLGGCRKEVYALGATTQHQLRWKMRFYPQTSFLRRRDGMTPLLVVRKSELQERLVKMKTLLVNFFVYENTG